jgi:hypothetical protein
MEGQGLDWHGRTVGRNTVEEGGLEAGVPLDFWGMAESGKCDLQARIKRSKACLTRINSPTSCSLKLGRW